MFYTCSLPSGIDAGTVVKIRGVAPCSPDRFQIGMTCSEWEDADYALHITPCFQKCQVIFNAREDGVWGTEEIGNGFPFHRGQDFEVMIITDLEGFKIVIGDQKYHHFRYRIPVTQARRLEVSGKVTLESVSIF